MAEQYRIWFDFFITRCNFLIWPQLALSKRLIWGISADKITTVTWKSLSATQKMKVFYIVLVGFFIGIIIFYATYDQMRFVLGQK